MEASDSCALEAVQTKLVSYDQELYETHLVTAETLVKIAASKQKNKLLEFGLTGTEVEILTDVYLASSSGQYSS